MRKSLLSSSVLVALLLTGGVVGSANAAPLAPTCAEATAAVAVGQDRVQGEAADVRAAEDNLKNALKNQTDQQEIVDAILGPPLGEGLAAAQALLALREDQTEAARRNLEVNQDELQDAQADLAALETVRQRICSETPVTTTPAPPPFVDKDCPDFSSQRAAQVVLDFDKSDPNNLDANKNGVACEEFFLTAPTSTAPPTIVGDDVIGEDNDVQQTVNINVPDNDPDDGVRFRPNTSRGVATG